MCLKFKLYNEKVLYLRTFYTQKRSLHRFEACGTENCFADRLRMVPLHLGFDTQNGRHEYIIE